MQYLIWNRRSWAPGRGWRTYTGVSPHTDHIHVELNRSAPVSTLYLGAPKPTEPEGLTVAEADRIITHLETVITQQTNGANHGTRLHVDRRLARAGRPHGRLHRFGPRR